MGRTNITIGRNPGSDVQIDERWDTVSNNHAEISSSNGRLTFTDHSSNGTVINNQKIHNTSVEINPGDVIKLANVFTLDWVVIRRFFPDSHRPTVVRNSRYDDAQTSGRKAVNRYADSGSGSSGRLTEDFRNIRREEFPHYDSSYDSSIRRPVDDSYGRENKYSQSDIDKELEKWNWGAFFCSWLWAPFNGIYWPLFILLIAGIPYLGQVCSLCLCVYLGLNGSKMAWRSNKFSNFEQFKRVQRNWAVGGIIFFIVGIVGYIYLLQIALSIF